MKKILSWILVAFFIATVAWAGSTKIKDDMQYEGTVTYTKAVSFTDDFDMYFGSDLDFSLYCDTAGVLELDPLTAGYVFYLGTGYADAVDVRWFGDTSGDYVDFDEENCEVLFTDINLQLDDAALLIIGTGDDFTIYSDTANTLEFDPATAGATIKFGTAYNDAVDLTWYGDTDGDTVAFDEENCEVLFTDIDVQLDDAAKLIFGTGDDLAIYSDTADTLTIDPGAAGDTLEIGSAYNDAIDFKWYGDTDGDTIVFDEENCEAMFTDIDIQLDDNGDLIFGTGDDFVIDSDTANTLDFISAVTDETGVINLGADTTGIDLVLFGATTGEYLKWDASADSLLGNAGNYLFTGTDAEANQFKVDATGAIAGYGIVLETTDGGVQINADGSENGDIAVDSADDMTLTAGGDLTLAVTGTVSAGGSSITNVLKSAETVTATNVITAAESGKVFFLNSETEFASTLPALSTVSAGTWFKFIIVGAPSGADYTIVTGNSGENQIYGEILSGATSVPCSAEDTIHFEESAAIQGDWVEVISDGTSWYINGLANAAGAITATAD